MPGVRLFGGPSALTPPRFLYDAAPEWLPSYLSFLFFFLVFSGSALVFEGYAKASAYLRCDWQALASQR